jgi:glycosyltransferase involved in cell wall biosynthesis
MIPVYNEADIIRYVIEHLISQGIKLDILDNGSTDGSYEICSQYVGRGVVFLEQLATERWSDLLIQRLYQTALRQNADWTLLSAADEFLESPYPRLTLSEAIISDDRKGFNLIQFNDFEFWPTEKDYQSLEPDVRKRMKYYTWGDDVQFRCWKVYPGINVGNAGHYPEFPRNVKIKIPRKKYVLRHYRIRSYRHGLRKVFSERLPRYDEEEKRKGLHVQYDKFGTDLSYFVINSANLIKYGDDGGWVLKKTFDGSWGVRGKPWPHPPNSAIAAHMRYKIANHFPVTSRIWKAIFLRKKRFSTSQPEGSAREK